MPRVLIFRYDLHKKLWKWLSENPMKDKYDWPGWEHNGGMVSYVSCHCFACEAARNCGDCPLDWGTTPTCVTDLFVQDWEGLYSLWGEATNPTRRSALALQIAELPLKKNFPLERVYLGGEENDNASFV